MGSTIRKYFNSSSTLRVCMSLFTTKNLTKTSSFFPLSRVSPKAKFSQFNT